VPGVCEPDTNAIGCGFILFDPNVRGGLMIQHKFSGGSQAGRKLHHGVEVTNA
jgi:hypothetical protein